MSWNTFSHTKANTHTHKRHTHQFTLVEHFTATTPMTSPVSVTGSFMNNSKYANSEDNFMWETASGTNDSWLLAHILCVAMSHVNMAFVSSSSQSSCYSGWLSRPTQMLHIHLSQTDAPRVRSLCMCPVWRRVSGSLLHFRLYKPFSEVIVYCPNSIQLSVVHNSRNEKSLKYDMLRKFNLTLSDQSNILNRTSDPEQPILVRFGLAVASSSWISPVNLWLSWYTLTHTQIHHVAVGIASVRIALGDESQTFAMMRNRCNRDDNICCASVRLWSVDWPWSTVLADRSSLVIEEARWNATSTVLAR